MPTEKRPRGDDGWRVPTVIALLLTGLLCIAYALHWLDGVETRLLDMRFAICGDRSASNDIVLVAIDDATVQEYPSLPADPEPHARLVRRLTDAGAAVIALDIPELTREAGPADETAVGGGHDLTAAIAESGRVVLPAAMVAAEGRGPAELPSPVARFSPGAGDLPRPIALRQAELMYPRVSACAAAAGLGVLNVYPDRDGTLRAWPLLVGVGGRLCPSFALETIRVALGEAPAAYSVRLREDVAVAGHRIPIDAAGETLINFVGPGGSYRTYSYARALRGNEPSRELVEAVGGRIVVVGATATGLGSYHPTPFTPYLTGAEVQASAIDTLLSARFIRPASTWIAILLTFSGGLLSVLLTGLLPSTRAAAILAVVVVGIAGASVALFAVGLWMPTAAPLLSVLLVGGVLVARKGAGEYVERRRVADRVVSRIGALARVGRLLNLGLDREQLLTEIMAWIEDEIGCEAASLVRLDEETQTLAFEIALGPKGDEMKDVTMQVGEGIVGTVVATGEPMLVPDTSSEPRFARDVAEAVGFPAPSILCVPMSVRGRVVGAIEVLNKRDGSPFTRQDAALLTVIAQHAAMFLETARLYGILEERVDLANLELRLANDQLAVEKAKLEAIVEQMADGVIAAEESGRIVLVNQVAEEMLGCETDSLEGRAASELPHPELAQLLGEDLEVVGSLRELTFGDPVERIVRARSAVAADEQGVAGRVVVLTDITDLRELDRTKTDMVSFVSHELKNPLGAIRGFAGLIRDRSGDEGQREHAAFISRQAERMYRLIDDFLNVARIDMGRELEVRWEDIDDVEPLVDEAIESETRGDPSHAFAVEVDDDLPPIQADPHKLHHVLVNLISNAVKYSPDGGCITVRVMAEDEAAHFSVSDEGIGVAQDSMQHLFKRFRRVRDGTTDRVEGTGLGLFLALHLVQAHDGRMWAESVPGSGSTFHFTIPIEAKADDESNSQDPAG